MGSRGLGGMAELGDLIGSCLIGPFEPSLGFARCSPLLTLEQSGESEGPVWVDAAVEQRTTNAAEKYRIVASTSDHRSISCFDIVEDFDVGETRLPVL